MALIWLTLKSTDTVRVQLSATNYSNMVVLKQAPKSILTSGQSQRYPQNKLMDYSCSRLNKQTLANLSLDNLVFVPDWPDFNTSSPFDVSSQQQGEDIYVQIKTHIKRYMNKEITYQNIIFNPRHILEYLLLFLLGIYNLESANKQFK